VRRLLAILVLGTMLWNNLRERRFHVRVPDLEVALTRVQQAGAVATAVDGVNVLTPPFHHLYHSRFGLIVGDDVRPDAGRLVV